MRFFSIDGGHWLEIVAHDLSVAEGSLAPHGVIALDDFHRPEWPEVSAGFFAWNAARQRPLVPCLIGFNKLYLCAPLFAEAYRNAVRSDRRLAPHIGKTVRFLDQDVPVLTEALLPEYGVYAGVVFVARLHSPLVYKGLMKLWPLKRALDRVMGRRGGQGRASSR